MTDAELLDWLETEAKNSYTGISIAWMPKWEDQPSGYRFMRHSFIGDPVPTVREAIRLAMEIQRGKELGPVVKSRSLAKASAIMGRMIPQPKKKGKRK